MKKLMYLAFAIFFMASCAGKELERQQALIDSLNQIGETKDVAINDFIAGYNQIQDNLRQIKEKENIINRATGAGGELEPDAKEAINEDILTIYELMLQNKQKAESLERKLQGANVKAKEFQKMIAKLQEDIAAKDGEINDLKTKLAQMNIDIENLNTAVNQLSSNVDSLSSENKTKAAELEQKTDALNTAYYVFGTKKELKDNGVLTKEGGFIGIGKTEKLKDDFNANYFTKVDIREVANIMLSAKKAQLITSHPAGSYRVEGANGAADKLIIVDAKKFWSVSKYLVIVTE